MSKGLGQIVKDKPRGMRDAFHVHAVLVTSDDELKAGNMVRFTDRDFNHVRLAVDPDGDQDGKPTKPHAMVDPFLVGTFRGNESCVWVLLLPETSKDLRHTFELTIDDLKAVVTDVEGEWTCKDCW